MRGQAMQKLVEKGIEMDEKPAAGKKLPETMILYTMDADHFIITAKPQKTLEENTLTKMHVKVIGQQNKYLLR